jgi:hypothetical protein
MSADTASSTKLTYDGAVYDLTEAPAANSKVVADMKAEVLGGVRLDKLAHNLGITGDLIYLAFCATPPKHGKLRGDLDMLHIQFGDIAGECINQLGDIKSASREVTRKLGTAFGMIYKGREDVALTMLSRCAAEAGQLAVAAAKLAAKFNTLCDMADKALTDSQVITGDEIKARDALKDKKGVLLAEQANLTTLQERLAELVSQLKLEYNEAKGKLEKTEDRAFALAITGAIMQPLGQAIGGAGQAVAMVYGARANPLGGLGGGSGGTGSAPAPTPAPAAEPQTRAPSAEDQRRLADAQAAFAEAELDLEVLEADEKTLEAMIEVSNEWLQTLPTRQTDPDERRKADAGLRTGIGRAQRDLDTTKSERDRSKTKVQEKKTALEAIKTAAQALGVAISDAGKNLSAVGNDYMKVAESQRDTLNELFKTLIAKQDKEREILGQVKQAALRLENISLQVDSAEVTISALFQVIAAMKQVVAILHEARLFWLNMETACKALAAPAFQQEMRQNMNDFPTENRIDLFYNNNGFRLTLLNYLAKWRALEVIAGEYIEATKGSRDKIVQDFNTLLVGERVKAKVKELSTALLGEIANDIEKLDAETTTVRNAQQLMAA